MRKGVTIAFVLALLVSGCGSGGDGGMTTRRGSPKVDEGAAKFAVGVQALLKSARFAKAWRSLHPAERKVVSAQRLAACYPRNEFPGNVTFRASKVRDVRWTVPGTGETSDAKEVTIAVTSSSSPKQTFAQHVVRVKGAWAWMLSSAYFAKAKNGTC